MQFSEVSEKDLLTIWPDNGAFKNINKDEEKEQYVRMYNLYRRWFSEFFIDFLKLKSYDDAFSTSNLKFVKLKNNELDIYQYYTCPELNFFYFRNNLYIEHLSEEEKHFLLNKLENHDYLLDEKAKEFIKSTFKKVIREHATPDDKKAKILYGPNSARYLSDNDTFIIAFKYNEFDLNGQNDDEWDANHKQQQFFIRDTFVVMAKRFDEILDIEYSIISYGSFSTRPLEKDW